MSIKKYRRIWELHHGPIPKDQTGRSLEIHHIDGDHDNNSITNLQLVTIEEHYDIHYNQGDWQACHAIALRMLIDPAEFRKIVQLAAEKRRGVPRPDLIGDKNPMCISEVAKRLGDTMRGKTKPESQKLAMSKAAKNRCLQKFECPNCKKSFSHLNFKRWHGQNCKEINYVVH